MRPEKLVKPFTHAWWKFSWKSAVDEVARRYPYQVRVAGLREKSVVDWYKEIFGCEARHSEQYDAFVDLSMYNTFFKLDCYFENSSTNREV